LRVYWFGDKLRRALLAITMGFMFRFDIHSTMVLLCY